MLLGCVADDLTGATDVALMLSRSGMRTVQTAGLPEDGLDLSEFDAVVVALKSRTVPAAEAVAQSLATAEKLRRAGATRLYFKYCSTFDSTDRGNIGPVSEALLAYVNGAFTVACPAFPANARTVYQGSLFVGDTPLNESGMKDHPLTPMRDADLRRVLQRQTRLPVGHVAYAAVEAGAAAIRAAFAREVQVGKRILIVDALSNRHLEAIGAATAELPLVTGGSGLALGLPRPWHEAGLLSRLAPPPERLAAPAGRAAILAGSCSVATRGQVAKAIAERLPTFRIDPLAIANGSLTADAILQWIDLAPTDRPVLVYSSDEPEAALAVQAKFGREQAGEMIEALFASVAAALPARGFTRLLVAGGETAGAVVQALGVRALAIGPEIDPGVPWTRSISGVDLALALKSGNFGAADFFLKAWSLLQ